MTQIRPLVAGNWKMNGTRASWQEALNLAERLAGSGGIATDVMLCPPATLLHTFASGLEGQNILVGAQNCHSEEKGAHTGELSAEMLADAGADAVIVGHSERRADNGETNPIVNAKARAAHRAGLTAIICIGETEDERKQGETLAIVGDQLSGSLPGEAGPGNTVIAYEPVWAIGTGLTPTLEDVAEVHGHIRTQLSGILGAERAAQVRILYGGSVKPDNAADLMGVEHVNGALVGGASLNASDFWGIISVYGQT